jgi:hypothetical protein
MYKCDICLKVRVELGNKTPVGYLPFAWGNNDEKPRHFYVFKESDDINDNDIQLLDVIKLCVLENPIKR